MQLIESEKLGAREVPSVVRTPSAGEKKRSRPDFTDF